MQFQYTATNTDGKELNGVINAESIEEAHTKLNQLNLTVIGIQPTQEQVATATSETPDLPKYEFEATDNSGKQVKGTIPASDALFAYKRLVEEYHFNVLYLAGINATPEEKTEQRQVGIQKLKNQYEFQKNEKASKNKTLTLEEDPAFISEKNLLLQQVDAILDRTQKLLGQFEAKLSQEKRTEIEGYIDKLLRIKSSNNLDYILHTCKDLLGKVQQDELFLNNQEHTQERETVMMESQKMMVELNKAAAIKTDMGQQIKIKLDQVEEKLSNSSFAFLLHPLHRLKEWFEVEPEIQNLKTQLNALRSQRLDAFKVALKSPKETKHIAWKGVKDLNAQIKKVRHKLHDVKHRRHENNLMIKRAKGVYLLEELSAFTGWLLFFYLAYYFLGHYVVTRGLSIDPLLKIPFDLRDSAVFKYLLALIFLIHGALSLKLNFFVRSTFASIVLASGTLAMSILVLFNI